MLAPFVWRELPASLLVLRREWRLVVGLGATGIAAFHTMVYVALETTTATNALLTLSLSPIAILAGAALSGSERPVKRQALGALISILGAVVLVTRGDVAVIGTADFTRGDLWMLAAIAIWAAYSLLLRRRPADLPQAVALFASVVTGLVLLLPFLFLASRTPLATFASVSVAPQRRVHRAVRVGRRFPAVVLRRLAARPDALRSVHPADAGIRCGTGRGHSPGDADPGADHRRSSRPRRAAMDLVEAPRSADEAARNARRPAGGDDFGAIGDRAEAAASPSTTPSKDRRPWPVAAEIGLEPGRDPVIMAASDMAETSRAMAMSLFKRRSVAMRALRATRAIVGGTRLDGQSQGQVTRSSAADVYDEYFVPALFAEWAGRVADASDLVGGEAVLDVACGTGALSVEAARRVRPGGAVIGLDRDDAMLTVARRKTPSVDWRLGMAELLPFETGCFDAVVSQFGLMFFGDRVAALREMWRVLDGGGRLAVAVWDRLAANVGYAAMAALVERLFGSRIADGLRSPFALGDREALRAGFAAAGIEKIEIATTEGNGAFSLARFLDANGDQGTDRRRPDRRRTIREVADGSAKGVEGIRTTRRQCCVSVLRAHRDRDQAVTGDCDGSWRIGRNLPTRLPCDPGHSGMVLPGLSLQSPV